MTVLKQMRKLIVLKSSSSVKKLVTVIEEVIEGR